MSRRLRKKLQAVALVFVMFVSMFQGIPGLEFGWAKWVKAVNFSDKGCVDWVKYRAKQIGIVLPATGLNKYGYYGASAYWDKLAYYGRGSEPATNSLAVWEFNNGSDGCGGKCGHVAFVENVNGNNVTVTEGGWVGAKYAGHTGVGIRTVSKSQVFSLGGCSGFLGYIYLSGAPEHDPEGFLDAVWSAPGQITVSGWALDRDCPSKQINVHIYIGDSARVGTTAEVKSIVANTYRDDVDRATGGMGAYHGFYATINTNKTGNQKIYAYGINVDKNGKDNGKNNPQLINVPTVNIPPKITYSVNTGSVTNIKNKDAKISGSLTPSGNANSWGFYIGPAEDKMTRCTVAAASTASANMSAQIAKYYPLKPGTKYYYRTWAHVNGQEKKGSVSSFTTTAVKPEIPTVKTDSASKDIGISDAPSVSWNAVEQADSYIARLYDGNGELVQKAENIVGTKYAFKAVETSGTYTATIEAVNEIGSKEESEPCEIEVHPDVTVKFMDADSFVDADEKYQPAIVNEQQVHWGKSANKPADPSHTGYTFKKWDGNYSNVKEDTTVKAVYEIKQYTVTYVDSETKETLKSEKVNYYSAGNPADYDVPIGYTKTGFDGWDKDYKHITEDTTLYTCIGWYNKNFPVFAEIKSAVREYDAKESDNEGYTVVAKMTNWDESTTKGRVVVALKTEKGKLLTTTESSAFSIKKSSSKEMEIFVPYDKAASVAEIYVVGQYKDGVPITTTASNNATLEIDQTNTYTDWSEEEPPEDAVKKESRDEYRYQDKSTTTSYASSLDGYTQDGSRWVQSGSGSIDYVSSFPSGFWTGHSLYSAYHKTPASAYENATNKRTVSTSQIGNLYWHWCRGTYTSGPINRLVSDCWTSEFGTFHAFTSGTLGYDGSKGAFQCSNPNVCRDTYWWLASSCWNGTQTPIYRCKYTDYRKLFTYYKWSDFSDWNTNAVSASDTRKVETRKVYRYQSDKMMEQDDSGKERTVKGTLGKEFANKEATLFIYKVDEASDYTNEYVAQQKLDEDGNYEFNFKLREEPTAATGDFTITLGVEGTSTAIYLDTIEAPKKEYTVNFFDYNGKLISTEKVKEGDNAPLPDESKLERIGYTFSKWTDTNINITEDKDIYAEYKINEYNVVFVDWGSSTVEVKKFEYGSQLVAPKPDEPEEGKVVEWDAIADGKTTVTSDLVVCTRYVDKKCSVTIKDYENKVIKEKMVTYGDGVDIPFLDAGDDKIFLGWKDVSEGQDAGIADTIITKNVILCPVYVYKDTVQTPKASLETGAYNEVKKVTLSCETEDVDIYYTLDGTNPKGYDGILYTGPITIDDAVELQFYACKAGMNDSEIQSEMYSVNYNGAVSKWMTREQLPQEVTNNMSNYTINTDIGYTYKDVKKTSLVSEASVLENLGWKATDEEEYTEYSEWADSLPKDDDLHIAVDIDTKAVYSAAYQYKYSHYVYEDGTSEAYAASEVEGKECKLEETEAFDKPLSVAGFDKDDNPYYVFDGMIWFNQEKISGQVQTGNKYRSRYKVVTYTKWSDYSIESPAEDEAREYKEATVYNYVRHNKFIVNIHAKAEAIPESKSFFVEEGDKIDVEDYKGLYGYTCDAFYTDEKYTQEWDVENDTVTENVDLYVKYTPQKFNVTFIDKDGNEIETQSVAYKEAAIPPEMNDIEGYRFVGWSDDSYKNVDYDMTVTAKYVTEDEYTTVSLDNESLSLYVGKTADLTAIISPSSKSDSELEWSSSDISIVEVSQEGKVTGVREGKAIITVKVLETGETAKCNVTIKVNTDTTLSILKNSDLSVDQYGYLRGLKAGNCKVEDICNEFANDYLICKDVNGNELAPTDSLGTGSVINLMNGSKIMDSITIVVAGDISGDGAISNRDVSMLARMLLDKEIPTDPQILAGDVNGDGKIGNKDVVMISKARLGKEDIK